MSSSSSSSTATTLVAAIVTGTVMSATVSIFMKIGWSKTPPSVKTAIVDKGRDIKMSLSTSSESLKGQIRKRMSSLSPRNYRQGNNGNSDGEDEDENSRYYSSDYWYGRSSHSNNNNAYYNKTLNDHEMIVFRSLQTIFDFVATDQDQDCGDNDIRPSAESTTTNRESRIGDTDRSIFLPGPRLYLSLMTVLRSRNVINKLHPPENSFVDNWDDEDEHERVNRLLDFCNWAESSIVQDSHKVEENGENDIPRARSRSRSSRTKKFFQYDNRRNGPLNTTRSKGRNVLNLPAVLKAKGFKLLTKRTSTNDTPGLIVGDDNWSFGYFLAVHHGRKEIVISIGSRSKSNKFPASVNRTVVEQQQKQQQQQQQNQKDRQHDHGSLYETAARVVADDISHLIDNFFAPLQYDVYIVGHSVSAGVACHLGVLLKTSCPSTRLQVYAFGPPPCLLDQYQSPRDFITSVVNNNDCIPRINIPNLKHMMTLLERIDEKLKRWMLRSEDMRAAKKHRVEMEKLGAQVFLSGKDLNDYVNFDTHIYPEDCGSTVAGIPGRNIFLWNHTQDTSIIGATVCNSSSNCFSSKQMPSTHDCFAATTQQQQHANFVQGKFMIDPTIFYDHTLIAYKNNIELLIEQKANTI